jgi:FlaA1/EpsC-like NDP-sugar epimerase
VIRTVMAQPELGYRIVGLIDDQLDNTLNIGPVPALEGLYRIPYIVTEQRVDEVVVALPWSDHRRILDIFQQCDKLGVRARTVPDMFQLSLNRVDVEDLGGIPLIGLRLAAIHGANLLVKRIMDVALGSLIMIPMLPWNRIGKKINAHSTNSSESSRPWIW